MQSNFRLMSALLRGVWFIEEGYAQEQWPLVERLLLGQATGLPQAGESQVEGVFAVAPVAAGEVFTASPWRSFDKAPEGSVAVIPVHGVIMREDYCGDIGTDTRMQLLQQAAAHPNIAAIVLDINSPGGEASGLASFFDAVQAANTVKPVLAFVNDGFAASAGYFQAAPAAEIYLSHAHCGVGSIGCVLFLNDTSEKDKKDGIKRLAVYAPQSTDKNQDFAQAVAGKPELLREGMLREWCAAFIGSVQTGRGDRLQPDAGNPFTGKMYWKADESQALGLHDGVKSFQEVVQRALDLSAERASAAAAPAVPAAAIEPTPPVATTEPNNPNFSTETMKHPRLLTLLGLSMALETSKEGTHLQAAHLDAIEAALEQKETAEASLVTATSALTAEQTAHTAAKTDLAAKETEVTTLKATIAGYPVGTEAKKEGQETQQQEQAPEVDADVAAILQMKADLGISNS